MNLIPSVKNDREARMAAAKAALDETRTDKANKQAAMGSQVEAIAPVIGSIVGLAVAGPPGMATGNAVGKAIGTAGAVAVDPGRQNAVGVANAANAVMTAAGTPMGEEGSKETLMAAAKKRLIAGVK